MLGWCREILGRMFFCGKEGQGCVWGIFGKYLQSCFTTSLVSFILKFMLNFFLGFSLLIHDLFFILPLIGILGLSSKRHSWRNWLSFNVLLVEYGKCFNFTSIFFHGYFSLYLPFTWRFFTKIQSESYGELTANSSIKTMYQL